MRGSPTASVHPDEGLSNDHLVKHHHPVDRFCARNLAQAALFEEFQGVPFAFPLGDYPTIANDDPLSGLFEVLQIVSLESLQNELPELPRNELLECPQSVRPEMNAVHPHHAKVSGEVVHAPNQRVGLLDDAPV